MRLPLSLVALFCLSGCITSEQRREAEAIEIAKTVCAKLLAQHPDVKFSWEAKLQYNAVYAQSVPFGRLGFPTLQFRAELPKGPCRGGPVFDVFNPRSN